MGPIAPIAAPAVPPLPLNQAEAPLQEPEGPWAICFPTLHSDKRVDALNLVLQSLRESGIRLSDNRLNTDLSLSMLPSLLMKEDGVASLTEEERLQGFTTSFPQLYRLLMALQRRIKLPPGCGVRYPVFEPKFRPFSVTWQASDRKPLAQRMKALGRQGANLARKLRDFHPECAHKYQRAAAKVANFARASGVRGRAANKKLRHVLRRVEKLTDRKARQLVCVIEEMLWLRKQQRTLHFAPPASGHLQEGNTSFRQRRCKELAALPKLPRENLLRQLVIRGDKLKERIATSKKPRQKQLRAQLRGIYKKFHHNLKLVPSFSVIKDNIDTIISLWFFENGQPGSAPLVEGIIKLIESESPLSSLRTAIDDILSVDLVTGAQDWNASDADYLVRAVNLQIALMRNLPVYPYYLSDEIRHALMPKFRAERAPLLQWMEALQRQSAKDSDLVQSLGTLYSCFMRQRVTPSQFTSSALIQGKKMVFLEERSKLLYWLNSQFVDRGDSIQNHFDLGLALLTWDRVCLSLSSSREAYHELMKPLKYLLDFYFSVPAGYRETALFLSTKPQDFPNLDRFQSKAFQSQWREVEAKLDRHPKLGAYRLSENLGRNKIEQITYYARLVSELPAWGIKELQGADDGKALLVLRALPHLFLPSYRPCLQQIRHLLAELEKSATSPWSEGVNGLLEFLVRRRRYLFNATKGQAPIVPLLRSLKDLMKVKGEGQQGVVQHLIEERGLIANPHLSLTPQLVQALIEPLQAATTKETLTQFSLFFLQSGSLTEFLEVTSPKQSGLLSLKRAAILRSRAALPQADLAIGEAERQSKGVVEAALLLYKNVAISRGPTIHEALVRLASKGPHRVLACAALCAIERDPQNRALRDLTISALHDECTSEAIEQLLPLIAHFELEPLQLKQLLAFTQHPNRQARQVAIKALSEVPHEAAQVAVVGGIQSSLWNEYDEHYGLHRDHSLQHFHWLRFRPASHDNRESLFLRSLDQLAELETGRVKPLAAKLMNNWRDNEELRAFRESLEHSGTNQSRCIGPPLYLPPKTVIGRVLCSRGTHTLALLDLILHGCLSSDLTHYEDAWSTNWARLGFSFATHNYDYFGSWYNTETASCMLISAEYHNEQQRLGALRVENEGGFNSVFYRGVPKKWIQKYYVPQSFKKDLQRIFSEEESPLPKTFSHPDLQKIPPKMVPDLQREIRRDNFFDRLEFVKPQTDLKKAIARDGFTLCTQEEAIMESLKRHASRMVVRADLQEKLGRPALLLPHQRWGSLDDSEFAEELPKMIPLLSEELQEALKAINNHGRRKDGTRHTVGDHTVELVQGRYGGFGLRTAIAVEGMKKDAVRRVLRLAALFHDMGKREGRGKDHIGRSVEICRRHLYQNPAFFGVTTVELELVVGIIRAGDCFGEYLMDKISLEQVLMALQESKATEVTDDEWARLSFAFFAADASTLRAVQRHQKHYAPLLAEINTLSGTDLTWLANLGSACQPPKPMLLKV